MLYALPASAGDYPKLRDRSKYGAMDPSDVDQQIRRAARFRHLTRRILRHSAQMIGANYRPDPLGEGASGQVDADPRFKIAAGETLVHDYDKVPWTAVPERFLPANFARMERPQGRFELPLISLDSLEENLDKIPNGTVLLLARVLRPRIPVRISHLGFVIHQRSGRTIFRHASQEGWGRVVDEDLIAYLRRLDERSRWAIEGVNLQAPRHPKTLPGRLAEPGQVATKSWLP
jgi:hypothetical protein